MKPHCITAINGPCKKIGPNWAFNKLIFISLRCKMMRLLNFFFIMAIIVADSKLPNFSSCKRRSSAEMHFAILKRPSTFAGINWLKKWKLEKKSFVSSYLSVHSWYCCSCCYRRQCILGLLIIKGSLKIQPFKLFRSISSLIEAKETMLN